MSPLLAAAIPAAGRPPQDQTMRFLRRACPDGAAPTSRGCPPAVTTMSQAPATAGRRPGGPRRGPRAMAGVVPEGSAPARQPAALAAGQSRGVSMNTGICRLVLAWNAPRDGASVISLGHTPARAVSSSSSASTVNVLAPASTVILGLAVRLWYQSGWVGDPPLEAAIAKRPSA